MLVYWRVTQQHGRFSTCFASFHRRELFHLFFQQVFCFEVSLLYMQKTSFQNHNLPGEGVEKRNKEAEQLGATSPTEPTFEVFFGRFFCSRNFFKCPSGHHIANPNEDAEVFGLWGLKKPNP